MANTVGFILLVLLVTFLPGVLFPFVLLMKGLTLHPFRPFYNFLLVLNGFLKSFTELWSKDRNAKGTKVSIEMSRQVQHYLLLRN